MQPSLGLPDKVDGVAVPPGDARQRVHDVGLGIQVLALRRGKGMPNLAAVTIEHSGLPRALHACTQHEELPLCSFCWVESGSSVMALQRGKGMPDLAALCPRRRRYHGTAGCVPFHIPLFGIQVLALRRGKGMPRKSRNLVE